MSRPRAMTSKHCLQCRVIPHTPEQVDNRAKHRYDHRRLDRRREQWRASKRRKRSGAVAGLHAISCKMPWRCTCQPIWAYAMKVAA